jgi:hypothetical protein
MKWAPVAVWLACAGIAMANPPPERPISPTLFALSPAEEAAGWIVLFDGQSTDHWRGYKQSTFPPKGWAIEDECLKVISGGGGGDIVTVDEYGDFELSLEFKTAPKANSGIMYRVNETHDAPWMTGPEFQVLDDAGHGLEATSWQSAGACYELYKPGAAKALKPGGEFNHARIRLKDNVLQHWLNGKKIVECDIRSADFKNRVAASKFKSYEGFGAQRRGHICLQDHGDTVWFRTIRIRSLDKPLPGEIALFDGTSMRGWSAVLPDADSMDGTWSVQDSVMICTGQPIGYIRTIADYTNYVLKLEWRFDPVTKQAGNSGVLLRMVGEDKVWPKSVEAQLLSGSAGDFFNIGEFQMTTDPSRTNGRHTKRLRDVERPIGEWNEYEIICDHGDVTLIVNGDPINHAWDVAEESGKIGLQSEGAVIHFRNIRLAPITD